MSVIGIFAAVFGLTIVYEVVLLQRTREELATRAIPCSRSVPACARPRPRRPERRW